MRRLGGILGLGIVFFELVFCFTGPMALLQKQSILVFPLLSDSVSPQTLSKVESLLERLLAAGHSFNVVTRQRAEEKLRTQGRSLAQLSSYSDYARSAAQDFGLDKFISGYVMDLSRLTLKLSISDVKTAEFVRSQVFYLPALKEFIEGGEAYAARLGLVEFLSMPVKGVSLYDWIFFLVLAGEAVLGLLMALNKRADFLAELLLAPFLVLFIFAFIYALNANMDYMQRFIANSGQIVMARSTFLEQLNALLRFFPLIIFNLVIYIRSRRQVGRSQTLLEMVQRWSLFWVSLAAVLYGLSFPSLVDLNGLPVLAWICLVPLILVLYTNKYLWGVFYGTCFGVFQALLINFWLGTYGYLSLHFSVLGFLIEYFLFMLILNLLIRGYKWWGILTIPLAWVFFDYLRSLGYFGYAWGFLGVTQYEFIPLIQLAAWTGVWGVSFMVLLGNAAAAYYFIAREEKWSGWGRRPQSRLIKPHYVPPLAVCCLLALLGLGFALWLGQTRSDGPPDATVVLIQQNTDPRKHDYEQNISTLVGLSEQALESLAPAKPDLIVWSEGALMLDFFTYTRPEYAYYPGAKLLHQVLDFTSGQAVWLLTGTQENKEIDAETTLYYNSSLLLNPSAQKIMSYHKIHLVPVTEYFPYQKELPLLYEILQRFDVADWTPGADRTVFSHPRFRFSTPICFEDVFPDDVRRFVLAGAEVLINISNDYWSLSPVEGKQHGIHALFRAVENDRPLLRATASGLTVYINAWGEIQPQAVPFYQQGFCTAKVRKGSAGFTLYTQWGDWFPLACFLGLVFIALVVRIKR